MFMVLVFSEGGPCWWHFLGSELFSSRLTGEAEPGIGPNGPEMRGSFKASGGVKCVSYQCHSNAAPWVPLGGWVSDSAYLAWV